MIDENLEQELARVIVNNCIKDIVDGDLIIQIKDLGQLIKDINNYYETKKLSSH